MSIDRRTFNKLLSIALFSGHMAPSQARPSSSQENFYIQFNLFGSPSRWYFDSLLKPFDDSEIDLKNPMVCTYLETKKDRSFKTEYQTYKYQNFNVPILWQERILGTQRKIENLFSQALIIRGCDMVLDGHEVVNRKLVTPFVGGESITGRISDLSRFPLPTVQYLGKIAPLSTAPGAFKSIKNQAPININQDQEYFKAVFSMKNNQSLFGSNFRELLKVNKRTEGLLRNLLSFKKLNYDRIYKEYKVALDKYQSLIKKSISNYSKIYPLKNKLYGFKPELPIQHNSNYTEEYEHYGPWYAGEIILADEDLRKSFLNIDYPNLAEQFAMTEVLMKYKISQSYVLMINPPENIKVEKSYDPSKLIYDKSSHQYRELEAPTSRNIKGTFDTHYYGLLFEYLENNCFYYTFSHCLDGFIQFQKRESIFEKSLNHITGEFERTPKENLAGSDHGYQGHTSTFISGKFEKLYLSGNILTNTLDKRVINYNNGTWGMAAPMDELKGRTISYRNILNTICSFLNLEPMTNDPSLVETKGNYWKPIVGAKNVS